MTNTNLKKSFSRLLQFAPNKDITRINKFIISGCFARKTREVLEYIKRTGYESDITRVSNYIKLVKEQFSAMQYKFGQEIEVDFFCDVAGTKYFDDFIKNYDKNDFYQRMTNFNPDLNFTGDLSDIKRRAFTAVKEQELKGLGEGASIYLDALEMALKKIGNNPEDEINGVSKSVIALSYIMDAIGGTQLYLPKSDILGKIINEVGIYIDGFKMDSQSIARKYGVTFKTVNKVSKHVSDSIKNYEGANENQ